MQIFLQSWQDSSTNLLRDGFDLAEVWHGEIVNFDSIAFEMLFHGRKSNFTLIAQD